MRLPFDDEPLTGPVKVAVTRDLMGYPNSPAVTAAVDRAAEILAAAGYAVEAVDPPHLEEIAEAWMRNTFGEMELMLGETIHANGSDTINRIMCDYQALRGTSTPQELVCGMSDRTRLLRDWLPFLEEWPLVLTPSS